MDKQKTEKLNRFMNDKLLNEVVFDVLLQSFLKTKNNDVQYLAASRIAIDLLGEAWKELKKYKEEDSNKETGSLNVGL